MGYTLENESVYDLGEVVTQTDYTELACQLHEARKEIKELIAALADYVGLCGEHVVASQELAYLYTNGTSRAFELKRRNVVLEQTILNLVPDDGKTRTVDGCIAWIRDALADCDHSELEGILQDTIANYRDANNTNQNTIRELQKEVEIDNKLLDARNAVLQLIPECLAHGPGCLPHYSKWIKEHLDEECGGLPAETIYNNDGEVVTQEDWDQMMTHHDYIESEIIGLVHRMHDTLHHE